MRSILVVTLGVALLSVAAWGQAGSNEDETLDALLAQKTITWGHASWLVGRSVGTFSEATTPDQAAAKAGQAGWGPADLAPWAPLTIASYSQLLVRALSIPAGVVYGWFPSPRYAFRELIFRKVVPASLAPDEPVSGEEAMRYLQAAQDWKEARQ